MQHAIRLALVALAAGSVMAQSATPSQRVAPNAQGAKNTLLRFAQLPANSFSRGPTSARAIRGPIVNGVRVPFDNKQPIQGFSAILDNGDGSFYAMSDNGFGSMENSADYILRVYRIRPQWRTKSAKGRNDGTIRVEGYIELSDPWQHIPFAITNHFTHQRLLTGADFDIESIQRAADGTFWIGDEFGPFLLHFDAYGRLLQAPIALPDLNNRGKEIRAPQNPYYEEASAVRVMNAMRTHAERHGGKQPVFSPWEVMLVDGNPNTVVGSRANPPAGLAKAESEIFDPRSLQGAGYEVVCWTVNDKARMLELMALGVDGIISDRPDLLLEAVQEFENGKYLTHDGRIDITKFDAQGHRGGRNQRPENTLPSMEVALDNLMTTLELDCGVTKDHIAVLNHDPIISSQKVRRADGKAYGPADEVLIRDLTLEEIQDTFIADKLFRGPSQKNDPSLSPVSQMFRAISGMPHIYAMPSLENVFWFTWLYEMYYTFGPGRAHPMASQRARNARHVRFNVETKMNPRREFASRTLNVNPFTEAVAEVIDRLGKSDRADIQSFDFRTLLYVHKNYPQIRTVCLFGDFPKVGALGDGTNLQDENGGNTPWLAGLYWPYRKTQADYPATGARSGGFEGMALTTDGRYLLPLLEKPLVGSGNRDLLIHEFDLANSRYTGKQWQYELNARGSAIGDYIMNSADYGLVIERDGSQGNLGGFKAIYEVKLPAQGGRVTKELLVDLLDIEDPNGVAGPGRVGDVGIGGGKFAFPFVTIEDVVILGKDTIGVLNDNNFPFSVGRHTGSGFPDDNEFIVIKLARELKK